MLKDTPAFQVFQSSVSSSKFGVGFYIAGNKICGANNNVGQCGDHEIKNSSFDFNASGGILAIRTDLCLFNDFFIGNTIAGIRLMGSNMISDFNYVFATQPDSSDLWGDGVVVMPWTCPSDVRLKHLNTFDSYRAGVSNFGSIVKLDKSMMKCSAFDIDNESVAPGTFGPAIPPTTLDPSTKDEGGNSCGCPVASEACFAVSSGGLAPPPPVAASN